MTTINHPTYLRSKFTSHRLRQTSQSHLSHCQTTKIFTSTETRCCPSEEDGTLLLLNHTWDTLLGGEKGTETADLPASLRVVVVVLMMIVVVVVVVAIVVVW